MDKSQSPEGKKLELPASECGILLALPCDGSSVIVETQIAGFNAKRKATWDDAYRIVCDAKNQLEAMRISSVHQEKFKAMMTDMQANKTREMLKGGRA